MFGVLEKIKDFGHKVQDVVSNVVDESKKTFEDISRRSKNLYASNLDLAYTHLHKGNLSDAILRFKIVHHFAPKEDKIKYQYELGRCYFYKNNMTKAVENLEACSVDPALKEKSLSRLEIIADKDAIEKIPAEIISEDYNFFYGQFEKFVKDNKYQAQEETVNFFRHYQQKHDNKKISTMLDLGCGMGLAGYLVKELYPEIEITGIDLCEQAIKSISQFNQENKIYAELKISDFLSKNHSKKNFDIVFSIMSLQFQRDLANSLQTISKYLSKDGRLIVCLPLKKHDEHNAKFSLKDNFFHYNRKYIEEAFENAKLQILSSQEKEISTELKGLIVIASLS